MSEAVMITTRGGKVLTVNEWLEEQDKGRKEKEFLKEQEKEVKNLRRCIKRRTIKNGVKKEERKEIPEVRHLTDEEIVEEYIMPGIKEGTVSKGGPTISVLIKFLQSLEGRKVTTDVIAHGIKGPIKSVSSYLSRLYRAAIVVRRPVEGDKRKYLWGIAPLYKTKDTGAIVSLFNDFARKRREEKKGKEGEFKSLSPEGKAEEEVPVITEEDKGGHTKESDDELSDHVKKEDREKKEHTLKIVVEGSVKILFGLSKE